MSLAPPGFQSLPLSIVQLSLAAVLKCGQSFRWMSFPLSDLDDDRTIADVCLHHEYRLCLRDRVVCLRQSRDALFYRSVFPGPQPSVAEAALKEAETLAWLQDYFQLDIDLTKLYDEWSDRDPVFKYFRPRFPGIRILRQDPWESLVSFICSSNNNISRITKMVQSMCTQFSPPLLSMNDPSTMISDPASHQSIRTYHAFPSPSALAAPDVALTLRKLGFGYRAHFIQKTAKMLVDAHGISVAPDNNTEAPERWLATLRAMNTDQAREELLKFTGVGRKVADCILLMSLDKKEVIPVDTHVHQLAMKYYGVCSSRRKGVMTSKLYDEVNHRLLSVWGNFAGWAHSVLFTADLKSFSAYRITASVDTSEKVLSPTVKEACL